MLRAYKAVNSRILKKEAGIPLIITVLTAQIINTTKRRIISKAADIIKNVYATIRNQII
jgi:hypothetical protein